MGNNSVETVKRIIKLSKLYSNLDLKAIRDIMKTGFEAVITEKRCKELGIDAIDERMVDIPVFSTKYKLASGKYLKISDVSISEFNELRRRGLVIDERRLKEYRSMAVYNVDKYYVKEYELSLADISDDSIKEAIYTIAAFECKDRDVEHKISDMIFKALVMNDFTNVTELDDTKLNEVISIVYRISNIVDQKYIIDIKHEYYEQIISDLLDDMESNYIRRIAGIK